MTRITRVSKESIFSDLNNLNVITTTSKEYADCFGFTDEQELPKEEKIEVKTWYDSFNNNGGCAYSFGKIY